MKNNMEFSHILELKKIIWTFATYLNYKKINMDFCHILKLQKKII